ncbi:MAG: ATP-binding protein, partial [Firmicutes bacterium]|nr:ATP-binding protein [Bacillota bacterium]
MNRVSDARDRAPQEIELAIGNLQNAIDLLGNVYNDVRDALNEFVANAYDEFVQGNIKDGVVIVKLLPKAKPPRIVVSDNGRGMSREDLCRIVRNIANSSKRSGSTPSAEIIGEKGIGILGFQTLAEVCEIVTRHQASSETFCLELRKGSTAALIREAERDRLLDIPGTEVHLVGVDDRTFR